MISDEERSSPSSGLAADLDGDGDLDVLSASQRHGHLVRKHGWLGDVRVAAFGHQRTRLSGLTVHAADLDGNGRADVMTANFSWDEIAWHKYSTELADFALAQVVTSPGVSGPSWAEAADLDGDGDLDVISRSSDDDKIAWYENIDGLGTFGPQRVIAQDLDIPGTPFAADLDGDGDLDLLRRIIEHTYGVDTIGWYENTDGLGTFGPLRVVTTEASRSDAWLPLTWTATATWTWLASHDSPTHRLVRKHRWFGDVWSGATDRIQHVAVYSMRLPTWTATAISMSSWGASDRMSTSRGTKTSTEPARSDRRVSSRKRLTSAASDRRRPGRGWGSGCPFGVIG